MKIKIKIDTIEILRLLELLIKEVEVIEKGDED